MFNVTVHASVAVHVHLSGLSALADAVPTILASIGELDMSLKTLLEEARADALRDTDATNAMIALQRQLLDKLDEAAGDETAVREIVAMYRANTDTLAAAVAANTPIEAPGNPDVPPIVEPPADPGADTAAGGDAG